MPTPPRNATLRALRFRWVGDETFQAPARAGVPALIELGQLLQITVRILRDEETDEDSPAHRRGPPRWRAAEDLGHRPTRQSLDRQVSKGNLRL